MILVVVTYFVFYTLIKFNYNVFKCKRINFKGAFEKNVKYISVIGNGVRGSFNIFGSSPAAFASATPTSILTSASTFASIKSASKPQSGTGVGVGVGADEDRVATIATAARTAISGGASRASTGAGASLVQRAASAVAYSSYAVLSGSGESTGDGMVASIYHLNIANVVQLKLKLLPY